MNRLTLTSTRCDFRARGSPGQLKDALARFKMDAPEAELLRISRLVDDDNSGTLRFREFLDFMFIFNKIIEKPVVATKFVAQAFVLSRYIVISMFLREGCNAPLIFAFS